MNTFGKVLKRLRKLSGMTLEQVAKKIGSHKGYISGIENEKVNPPSVKFYKKIVRLFEKTALDRCGIVLTEEDLAELAWASKAPKIIRERVLARLWGVSVSSYNQLCAIRTPGEMDLDAQLKNVRAGAVVARS